MYNRNYSKETKVLFYIPSLCGGGAERVFVNLANQFVISHNVQVFLAAKFGGRYDSELNNFVTKIDLKGKSFVSFYKECVKIKPNYIVSTLDRSNIRNIILKYTLPFRCIHVTRAARVYERPTHKAKDVLFFYFSVFAYALSDKVIANSFGTKDSLIKVCKIKESKIEIIGNPVISEKQIRLNFECRKNAIHEKMVRPFILAVSSFKKVKRHDLLIQTFTIVSSIIDVDLYLLGEGELHNEILSEINKYKLNDRVKMMGFVSDLSYYYSHASCLVLTSEREGFCNVLVEALSYGLPIATFSCPGGPMEILKNGKYAECVPFGDINILAEKIVRILRKEIIYDEMQLNSRANDYSIETISQKYYQYISK